MHVFYKIKDALNLIMSLENVKLAKVVISLHQQVVNLIHKTAKLGHLWEIVKIAKDSTF